MTTAHEGQPREDRLAAAVEDMRQGVRQANHATINWQSDGIPAPYVGVALGGLSATTHMMDQLIDQLVIGLQNAHRELGHRHDGDLDADAAVASIRSKMQVAQELIGTAQLHLAEADAVASHLYVADEDVATHG